MAAARPQPRASRRHELYELAPRLRSAASRARIGYVDCQTDDARLVLENVLDAEAAGAVVASYARVAPPVPTPGHLRSALAVRPGQWPRFTIRARAVFNATGPFSDAFRGGPRVLRPTLGVHIVVDAARLPRSGRAVVLRSPRDNRLMFVLPAGVRTFIGTTDTDWPDPDGRGPVPGDEIRARGADVDYLLEAAAHAFPSAELGPEDVLSTFAGLRPLLASDAADPSATSREHAIWVDARGVLTVAGGKLTTMRRMAEQAVDRLIDLLRERGVDRPLRPCVTRERAFPGAMGGVGHEAETLASLHELGDDVRAHLRVQLRRARTRAWLRSRQTATNGCVGGSRQSCPIWARRCGTPPVTNTPRRSRMSSVDACPCTGWTASRGSPAPPWWPSCSPKSWAGHRPVRSVACAATGQSSIARGAGGPITPLSNREAIAAGITPTGLSLRRALHTNKGQ